MSTKRLKSRTPSARKIGTGVLVRHELKFHKLSLVDGSSKCDASETGNPDHMVHGVLFDIRKDERTILDRIEGVACGYDIKDVRIKLADGKEVLAFTYYATNIDPQVKPFCWYREHVLIGARENSLPVEYIQTIAGVDFIVDPDPARREKELSIYS